MHACIHPSIHPSSSWAPTSLSPWSWLIYMMMMMMMMVMMIIVIMPFIVTIFPLFEHPRCLRAHDQNCLVTGGASLHLFDRYSTNGSGQHRTVIGLIFFVDSYNWTTREQLMFVLMAYLPTFVCPKCELLKVGIFAFWIGWKIVATLGKIEPSIPTRIYRNGGERFFFWDIGIPPEPGSWRSWRCRGGTLGLRT